MRTVVMTGSNEFARTATVDKTYKDKYMCFVFIVRAVCFAALMFILVFFFKKQKQNSAKHGGSTALRQAVFTSCDFRIRHLGRALLRSRTPHALGKTKRLAA